MLVATFFQFHLFKIKNLLKSTFNLILGFTGDELLRDCVCQSVFVRGSRCGRLVLVTETHFFYTFHFLFTRTNGVLNLFK